MALTAALTQIILDSFDPQTSAYIAVTLNEEHRIKIFNGIWVKKLNMMMEDSYHHHFLNGIRKEIVHLGCIYFCHQIVSGGSHQLF